MIYTITDNNLHIHQSYKYSEAEMDNKLRYVRSLFPNSNVWKRSLRSLKAEWLAHNALYRLHILRSHTADADLQYPNHLSWAYLMMVPFSRLILKIAKHS